MMNQPINEVKRTLCILLSHEKGHIHCAYLRGSTDRNTMIPRKPDSCDAHMCKGKFFEKPMVEELGCFVHEVDVDMLTHHAARERKERGGCPI